ncbi:DNA-processing protein DprA [Clostridium estertheticum]|uniref:DNA-processing protein DprA n=1 Tax=Clostridium estertheticum TaxID=238834 RepID=UPI001C7D6526|nr:DNA-processing protein DprA [Clostridium estertheticum]MBX4269387.1 DNA-processing protein DprA [Clostridium estertheticum]WLC79270.1 DNA-processing protein DprA [Clostridium estertheticum]
MNDYDIWFSLVKLSPKIKLKLINDFHNTQQIWYYGVRNKKTEYFNNTLINVLTHAWSDKEIDNVRRNLETNEIKSIQYYEDGYPQKLKNYDDAPYTLFYKGNIMPLNEGYNISVVGSRKYSNYGKDVTKIICSDLCASKVNIISGMAKGIDTFAHVSCLTNDGYTCAVLGSGLDVIYPKENYRIFNEIVQKGAVISEFLPGTPPYAYNFPQRNRIISALGDIIIVIEAGEKSGSLITANLALEQGKDVMAVPGSIFSFESKGTNKLIKDGAFPLTSSNDIFEVLGIDIKTEKNTTVRSLNSKLSEKIYSIISDSPLHINDIIRITSIDIKQLYEVLFEMQIKNEVLCLSGNYYVRVNNKI